MPIYLDLNRLKSKGQEARERRARGLEEEAQSREAIEAENQIVVDDSFCVGGHDGTGFITDCELKDRARHSGNIQNLAFGPGTCHPRRGRYKKELCEGVTTAFNVYNGGLKAFHEHLVHILFSPHSRGHSSVLWAGQFEYSKNGGERVTHRCPFPTKVVAATEVDGESSEMKD